MWLCKLVWLLKPLGGTIKENLAHSLHFSSSSPISPSMHLPVFFSHMKYEASLIHSIQLIRQDGSAKARAKIRRYWLPLCRSGWNKKRGGSCKRAIFQAQALMKDLLMLKSAAAIAAASADNNSKTSQIRIAGFDRSTERNPPDVNTRV